jgi:hypothetical protein
MVGERTGRILAIILMDKTYILACLLAFGNENQSYSFHLFFNPTLMRWQLSKD